MADEIGAVADVEETPETEETQEEETSTDETPEGEEEEIEGAEGEGKEGEEEEEEETEEEKAEELESSERITSYTDIKKAFPEFFKKFPDVRNALFRESRYSEILGTPEDAEAAVHKAGVLDNIERDVIANGDPTEFLNTVKKASPESFEKIALSFLPYLNEANKELYYEVAAVPIKQLLRAAWKEGKGKDTDLGRAAAYIHQYFFGNTNVDTAVKGETKAGEKSGKSKREQELEEQINKINQEKYTSFKGGIDQSYIGSMSKVIREGLDKDERLNEYTKGKLVEDILMDIKTQLDKDTRYQGTLKSLWANAQRSGFSNDFKSRILSTALARAKSLVPNVRQKLVSDAIKSARRKAGNDDDKDKNKTRSFVRREGRGTMNSSQKTEKPLSDLDILRS